jgi:hypothetical protein
MTTTKQINKLQLVRLACPDGRAAISVAAPVVRTALIMHREQRWQRAPHTRGPRSSQRPANAFKWAGPLLMGPGGGAAAADRADSAGHQHVHSIIDELARADEPLV